MADRFDKSIVARHVKLVEIAVAALGVVGFWLHSIPIMFATLFMFGVIATLFGPIKYGILPDHLKPEELPAGNALVEGATFMAILLGTIVGGLAAKEGNHPAMFGALIMVFALLVLDVEPVHSAHRPGRSGSPCRSQHRALDRLAAEGPVERQPPVVGWPRDELVLAGRRGGALADAAAGEEHTRRDRGGRHGVPRGVLDLDRDRLWSRGLARRTAASCSGRPFSAPVLLGLFALDLGFSAYGAAAAAPAGVMRGVHLVEGPERRDRSRGPRDRRRPVHRPVVRGRAELGRRRQARPRGRGLSTCSTQPSSSAARWSSPPCKPTA